MNMKIILFCALFVSTQAFAAWEYFHKEDPMTGNQIKIASVKSSSYIEMGFPFPALRPGFLHVQSHPRNGKQIIFTARKSDIFCLGICKILVRFDDEKPIAYRFKIDDIKSDTMASKNDYSDFISKLKSAKRLRMAVKFYRSGEQIVEFDVSNFKSID